MNKFLDNLKTTDNFTFTENGARAYNSIMDACLDAFGALGAMKDSSEYAILSTFMPAFFADREKAMRILFYIRDIRGGQGMRRVFRVILKYLADNFPEYVINNLDNILFFGRGDDYLVLIGTECEDKMMEFIQETLKEDLMSVKNGGGCSLLAKWMPSENASSSESKVLAKKICKALDLSARQYRKMLSLLRAEIGIVESKMSQNRWDEIDFEKLPAKASMIYTDAFMRHVETEYMQYLNDVANGKAKVNAKSLFPVDIVKKCYSATRLKDRILLNAMWDTLPNYLEGVDESAICMCDTSGSMCGDPLMVSLALGIYCADKCNGPFKNHFITFDYEPVLQELTGDNIVDKVRSIRSINPSNTNFEAALQLILDTAVMNHMDDKDVPKKLYVISDMQFDEATGEDSGYRYGSPSTYRPFMQLMKERFENAGYTFPAIVYWNVRASKCGMFQETVDGENCCMVSGYSPSLFKAVLDGTTYESSVDKLTGNAVKTQKIDPIDVMNAAIMNERYDRVWAGYDLKISFV